MWGCGSVSYSSLSPGKSAEETPPEVPAAKSPAQESMPATYGRSKSGQMHHMPVIPEHGLGKTAHEKAMELLQFALGGTVKPDPVPSSEPKSQDSSAWSRAEGDVDPTDVEKGGKYETIKLSAPTVTATSMGADNGRVQVPIGMVSDSAAMRTAQMLALSLFTLINFTIFGLLFVAGLLVSSWIRVSIVGLGGGCWLGILLFNVRMAGKPRKVLQVFLNNKPKVKLGRKLGRGQVVVVKGSVSLLNEELLSTEFHNVPGLVLVESSLRSYHPGLKKADAWTEHVRQTRAVDFRITDSATGVTAIVRALSAAEQGLAMPIVHVSTEVPLSTAAPVAAPVPVKITDVVTPKEVVTQEDTRRKARVAAQAHAPQLMVCKGYIRQGQVITVMGTLYEEGDTLIIDPLSSPYNVSKFLLCHKLVPYFFPTWASGLVISDQRDI